MQFGRSTRSGVCSSIFTVFISRITTSADLFGRIDNGTQARSKIIKKKTKEKNNNPVRIFNLRAIRYVQRYLIVRTFAQSDLLKSDLRYRNSSFTPHRSDRINAEVLISPRCDEEREKEKKKRREEEERKHEL